MIKKALKLENLSKFVVISCLMGMGSCATTFVVNDRDPSPSYFGWNSEPGVSIWREKLSSTNRDSQEAPEWCQKNQAWVDGSYYELECYFKIPKDTKAATNYSSYRIDRYIHSDKEDGVYDLEFIGSKKKDIENDMAGKWRRFFGEEELLPIEKVLRAGNGFFMLSAIVAFIGVFIGLALLVIIASIMLTVTIFKKIRG